MATEFKSEKLKNSILKELGKDESDAIFDEDLNNVTSLSLDFFEKFTNEFDIHELYLLPNLKELTLRGFLIKDREIKAINKIDSLNELCLEFCNFKDNTIQLDNKNIKVLTLNQCDNIDTSVLRNSNVEVLVIENNEEEKMLLDVNNLGVQSHLKCLYINDFIISNLSSVNSNMPLLKELNIDGSMVKKKRNFIAK